MNAKLLFPQLQNRIQSLEREKENNEKQNTTHPLLNKTQSFILLDQRLNGYEENGESCSQPERHTPSVADDDDGRGEVCVFEQIAHKKAYDVFGV